MTILQGCANMLVMKNTCNFCYNASKKLLDCGGKCGGGASYCNKTCQTEDWKEHQKICKKGKYDRKTERHVKRKMKEDVELKKKEASATTIGVYNLNEWTHCKGIGHLEVID